MYNHCLVWVYQTDRNQTGQEQRRGRRFGETLGSYVGTKNSTTAVRAGTRTLALRSLDPRLSFLFVVLHIRATDQGTVEANRNRAG